MNIYKTHLFPYIEGDSLADREVTLTMTTVTTEDLPTYNGQTESKLVLHFKESDKGLILNKTNARAIAKLYGPETDDWDGERITLYTERVKAFGEFHNAVRVKAPGDNRALGPNDAPAMQLQATIPTVEESPAEMGENHYTT